LADFIRDFVTATTDLATPAIYRPWVAVSVLASTMGRRAWTSIRGDRPLFPNMYIVLVGPPGEGKTEIINRGQKALRGLQTVNLAPDKLSPERFTEIMSQSLEGKVVGEDDDAEMIRHSSLVVFLGETGTFLRNTDIDFLQTLASFYDCPDIFTYSLKHATVKDERTENACLNICLGAQPAWFAHGFPEDAFELGFPARLVLIYSNEKVENTYFDTPPDPAALAKIEAHLTKVERISGLIPFAPDAKELYQEWNDEGRPPPMSEPMLLHYAKRRDLHVAKMAMIMMAANHPEVPIVKRADLRAAMKMLFEAERHMPRALSGAGGNSYKLREEALLEFIIGTYKLDRRAVPEWLVRQRLSRMVPYEVMSRMLTSLIDQKYINALGDAPARLFTKGEKLPEKEESE
jgi:hypothetical protein